MFEMWFVNNIDFFLLKLGVMKNEGGKKKLYLVSVVLCMCGIVFEENWIFFWFYYMI